MRILVTGSRHLNDRRPVWSALDQVAAEHGHHGLTIVHGACPTGADWWATEWVWCHAELGVRAEEHPADWKQHGPAAGPIRNRVMVLSGADLCLAFPLGRSLGTRGCMRLAAAAGIPVKEHTP